MSATGSAITTRKVILAGTLGGASILYAGVVLGSNYFPSPLGFAVALAPLPAAAIVTIAWLSWKVERLKAQGSSIRWSPMSGITARTIILLGVVEAAGIFYVYAVLENTPSPLGSLIVLATLAVVAIATIAWLGFGIIKSSRR